MVQVKIYCEGISPLLMNPVSEEVLKELFSGVRKPNLRDQTLDQVAASKVYRDDNNMIGIPTINLFTCLVIAGRYVQFDSRVKVSTASTTLVYSFLQIPDLFLPLCLQNRTEWNFEKAWKTDLRRGRNPSDGAMVPIIRPRFNEWGFRVTFTIDESQIAEERVKTLLQIAGKRVGLCDFRPACRGPFGMFVVKEWINVGQSENGTMT